MPDDGRSRPREGKIDGEITRAGEDIASLGVLYANVDCMSR